MIKDVMFVLIVLSITVYAHSNKEELIDYIYETEVVEAETASTQ
jgi:hypothetical protein